VLLLALFALLLPLPWLTDIYRVNVLGTAFIWIMLGLGLNIVVGQAGLLVLGYVAFYAVGAYSYAILNLNFGNEWFGFWMILPLGGLFAAIAGILLSLPVLRLRGDYLAIVTLGFGEIVRVTLEGGSLSLAPVAWLISLFTDAQLPAWFTTPLNLGGPAGIGGIPYPGFFGLSLGMDDSIRFVYYIALCLAVLTIIAVARLRDSRIGRSWIALREDEIACEAMGINKAYAKLSAFAMGACWAGFGGVLFAAKTTFINPASFTFMESVLILSVVVLGGLGSILGVALGACILILLPEYLRSFNEYRMLIFGASMVLMMVFRPQGLITPKAKKRIIAGVNDGNRYTKPPALNPGEFSSDSARRPGPKRSGS
jgi:branched-chain amino acid transport system permease protein